MAKNKKPADGESMDAVVRVQLSEGAVAERGRALAEKLGVVKALRDQKKAEAEKLQSMIDTALDEAEELRLEILEGAAEKRQGDLFASDVVTGSPDALPPVAAANTLAEVAKRAGVYGESPSPFEFTGDEPPEAPVQTNAELEKSKRGGKGVSA